MKLSAADLAIIASTLHGSLPITGNSIWTHTQKTRQETLEKVHDLMKSIDIVVTEVQQPIKRVDTETENRHEEVDWKQLCSELLEIFYSYDGESSLDGILQDMRASGNVCLDRARQLLGKSSSEASVATEDQE